MFRVKICGITRPEDGIVAADSGADAIGLVFAESPRRVTVEQASAVLEALPPGIRPVALFVDEPFERVLQVCWRLGVTAVQLSGDEPAALAEALAREQLFVIKSFHVRTAADLEGIDAYPAHACLLDSRVPGRRGGTGVAFDWSLAAQLATWKPVILAGGLNPDNVREAIRQVEPYAVDVSSGVEAKPGIKDPTRVRQFVEAALGELPMEPAPFFYFRE